jgi:arylsulfatase A-like enzyme
LDQSGRAENTIVVMTSDNGWPFPRAKANLYDAGTRMPMAIRWPAKAQPGWTTDAFINHTDLAPTFLEVAGLEPLPEMTGRSFLDLLTTGVSDSRDVVLLERERHARCRAGDIGYPIRAIRTREFLYIRNLRPDRWPAGDPDCDGSQVTFSQGIFGDIDKSPTKWTIIGRRDDKDMAEFFRLSCAKRPGEELYDLLSDPWQLRNVADLPEYIEAKRELRAELDRWMLETSDPRASCDDDHWDQQPFYSDVV